MNNILQHFFSLCIMKNFLSQSFSINNASMYTMKKLINFFNTPLIYCKSLPRNSIGINDKILNKPGRLTPEEFDEMKKHTIIGESILKNVGIYQNEELVQLAMQICRWHHERYDGRGYPDGLKGEEIPIEVQVVSIADVYDALVSERVYKKAYSHKKAVEMILNGECGQFNPLLLECLQDIQDRIDEEFQNVENQSEEENQERKVHDQIMETTVLG